jgi:hypothetical protein
MNSNREAIECIFTIHEVKLTVHEVRQNMPRV